MKREKSPAAFSLVEVVLAVGIAGFVLVAITGLLTVSLKSARDSATDTLVVGMANRVLSELRATAFTNLSPSLSPMTNTVYFDDLGMQVATPGATGFVCKVVMQGDPDTLNSDATLSPAQRINLVRTQLIFSVQGQSATNRVVHSTLARY